MARKKKDKFKGGLNKHYNNYKIPIDVNYAPMSFKFINDELSNIQTIESSNESISSLIETEKIEISVINDDYTGDVLNLFYVINIKNFITDINHIIMQIIYDLIINRLRPLQISSNYQGNFNQQQRLDFFKSCIEKLIDSSNDLFYLFSIVGSSTPFTSDIDIIRDNINLFIPFLTIIYNLYFPNTYPIPIFEKVLDKNHIIILYKWLLTRLLLIFYPFIFETGIYKFTIINPDLSTLRYSSRTVNNIALFNMFHITNITIFFTDLCKFISFFFKHDYKLLDDKLSLDFYMRTVINPYDIDEFKILDEDMNELIKYKDIKDLLLKSFKETIQEIKEYIFTFDTMDELIKNLDDIFDFEIYENITFLFNLLSNNIDYKTYLLLKFYNKRTLNDDIELLILLYFYSKFVNIESTVSYTSSTNHLYIYINKSTKEIVFSEKRFKRTNSEYLLFLRLYNFVKIYTLNIDEFIETQHGLFVKNIFIEEPTLLKDVYTQEPISQNNAFIIDIMTVVDFDSIIKIFQNRDRRFDYLIRILFEKYVLPYYPSLTFDDVIENHLYLILLGIYRHNSNINDSIKQKILIYLHDYYVNRGNIEILNDDDKFHLYLMMYIYYKNLALLDILTTAIFKNKYPKDITMLMQINIILYPYINTLFFITDIRYKVIINETLIEVSKNEYNKYCILLRALLLHLIKHYVILYFSKLEQNHNNLIKLIELYKYLNNLISSLSSSISSRKSITRINYLYIYRYKYSYHDRYYNIVYRYTVEPMTEFTDIYNNKVLVDIENDLLLETLVYDRDEIRISNELLREIGDGEYIRYKFKSIEDLSLYDLCNNERIIKEQGIHINGMIYNIESLFSFVINIFSNFLRNNIADYLPYKLAINQYNMIPILDPQFREIADNDVYLIIVKKYPEYITKSYKTIYSELASNREREIIFKLLGFIKESKKIVESDLENHIIFKLPIKRNTDLILYNIFNEELVTYRTKSHIEKDIRYDKQKLFSSKNLSHKYYCYYVLGII